jgi:hypothetical protein
MFGLITRQINLVVKESHTGAMEFLKTVQKFGETQMSFIYYLETTVSAVDIWAVRETCEEKEISGKNYI